MIIDITKDFSIDIGNGTDVGKVRQKNEDYLESFESPFGYVFVVCDGMGGHTAGEVASRLAVATIRDNILSNPQGVTSTKQIIVDSINLANHRIIDKWSDEPELKGMGTTVVVLIVKTNIAYYAHVGDSRMYMIRNKKIYQMTRDHSFVQTLVDGGLISYEEAETHPRKNEIMQALGITPDIKVDVNNIGLNLYKNDTFILCSDGLSGLMADEEIQRIVNTNDPQEASLKLISTANTNGGFDNITVQVVKVVKGLSIPKGKEDAVPLGALDKKGIVRQQDPFKPHSFDKTGEIPVFNGIQAQKKNKTMLYVLLVAMILIFGGLGYWKINSDNNKINRVTKTETNISKYRIATDLSISLDSIIHNKDSETFLKSLIIDYSDFKFYYNGKITERFNYDSLKNFISNNGIKVIQSYPIDTNVTDYNISMKNGKNEDFTLKIKGEAINYKFKISEIIATKKVLNTKDIKDDTEENKPSKKEKKPIQSPPTIEPEKKQQKDSPIDSKPPINEGKTKKEGKKL